LAQHKPEQHNLDLSLAVTPWKATPVFQPA
jgi:hypothetical protein